MPDNLTMELASIFGWDIDFALDIRKGDHFTVIHEELFLNGKKVKNGNIIAADFTNNGKTYRAVQYKDPKGHTNYFTPTGSSMRKAFLRTPVEFSRISSRYGMRRHPTLNRMRAHKGVDYASPRGTPIRATGDGKIVHRARKGGYGKVVIIRHGNRYQTLYAHMSNYNRKARLGKHVKQGQIIGYVGSTGRATGPHLHYEFRVHGVHRNPLKVRLPQAAAIAKKYKKDFMKKIQPLLAQLEILNNSLVAMKQP
jgi:murein DD-endopeptidase MepM/ murein hydrolase activator NlpD